MGAVARRQGNDSWGPRHDLCAPSGATGHHSDANEAEPPAILRWARREYGEPRRGIRGPPCRPGQGRASRGPDHQYTRWADGVSIADHDHEPDRWRRQSAIEWFQENGHPARAV